MSQKKTCKALFEFKARKEAELSLAKGDMVYEVSPVNKDWWKGTSKDGKRGVFPANYVVVVDKQAVTKVCVAKFDFDGKGDKISFKKGQSVSVLAEVSSEWWSGINEKGESGLFPASYVSEDSKPVAHKGTFKPGDLNAMAAAARKGSSNQDAKEVFSSPTLVDFPITFKVPRKRIPRTKPKYRESEGSAGAAAQDDVVNKLRKLEQLIKKL